MEEEEILGVAEMGINEVKAEIEKLQTEIEEHKAELEEVKSQLPDMSEGKDIYDIPDPNPETEGLRNRARELEQLILEKQMKITALERRLRDLEANEGMSNFNEEE